MSDSYFVVAVVDADGIKRALKLSQRPTPREMNVLHALGEHVSRVISVDDVCHRVKISVGNLRVTLCRIRKKLHYNWMIDSVNNQGVRLCYIGSPLADADRTVVRFDAEAVRRTRVQSEQTRQRIRETQIRKQAYLNFYKGRISAV